MRIIIDTQTTLGKKSGFGFYVENLVNNLKKVDSKNEYFFVNSGWKGRMSTPKRFRWDQHKLVGKARKLKADVVHQPCFSVPIFGNFKKVVTIHDLIPIKFPKNLGFASRMFFTKFMPFTYRYADKIIAISESTKKDLVEILGIDEKKIRVIYEAASENFQVIDDMDKIVEIKKKYKITGPYILNVGTLEPRKNLELLVRVFASVIKDDSLEHRLVLVGKKGWGYEKLFKLIKDLNIEDRVIWTDYVEDDDLPYIYNGASLFAFPSLYEGFGLPILEAMKCGVPVISSNTSSMPEIVSDAGILIDPKDEKKWVKEIGEVLNNDVVQVKLREKGLEQAKKFSWEKCARETLEVYEKLSN